MPQQPVVSREEWLTARKALLVNEKEATRLRAPLPEIEAYKRRMEWSIPWASSFGSDFNFDYHVSVTADDIARGNMSHNFTEIPVSATSSSELPALALSTGTNLEMFSTLIRVMPEGLRN
jgi:predicted dithiol-disulfide oxidoreductase (DUF899 family)